MDYIISDDVLIPKKNYKFYNEEILNMPNSFLPSPEVLNISKKDYKRDDLNIPKDCFVFGSFNNSYKITPEIFYAWTKVLKRTDNSILWLLNKNSTATKNLKVEAKRCGIDNSRIIFADKLTYKDHLKRFENMDLFLDTFPYNAHVTAMEALRTGVPILTIIGETFASRVAGSLLSALDLNYLICNNIDSYIEVACEMASNKKTYKNIKLKLLNNIDILSNSKKYTKDLEDIYTKLALKKL